MSIPYGRENKSPALLTTKVTSVRRDIRELCGIVRCNVRKSSVNYAELFGRRVKQNGCAIAYVKDQTPVLCLEAVRQDGRMLRYVKDQTPEICLAAVEEKGLAIQ